MTSSEINPLTPETRKLNLITWILTLPEDAAQIAAVEAIRRGQPPKEVNEGRALNISTAAKRTGLSRTILYRALSTGALKAFYPYAGAHARITEGELARWMMRRA